MTDLRGWLLYNIRLDQPLPLCLSRLIWDRISWLLLKLKTQERLLVQSITFSCRWFGSLMILLDFSSVFWTQRWTLVSVPILYFIISYLQVFLFGSAVHSGRDISILVTACMHVEWDIQILFVYLIIDFQKLLIADFIWKIINKWWFFTNYMWIFLLLFLFNKKKKFMLNGLHFSLRW